jgi:hypothetical protein
MDWLRGGFTISNGAWGTIEEKGVSGVLESKVSISVEWSVWIGWVTWGGGFEIIGT